ncbi:MAG: quinol:electron acceptor oxidoreductase subunit ActD [Rubripirellula sp.]
MSENNEKKVHGIVAEYTSVDSLLNACRRVRDAGYKKTDAFAPFAVHGIEKALGIKPTVLPWIVFGCGAVGTIVGLTMQIWMNSIDYPYIISGKPMISLPAFIPVAYELTILFAAFGAFFGMWALNGLPRFSNPIFTDPRFDRVTDDRFFLYIDAKDEQFDEAGVRQLFGDTGTEYIQTVVDDDSSSKVPKGFFIAWAAVIGISVIPVLVVLKMRLTKSSLPRFHVFFDMDFSPAKDAQQTTTLFADGRAMRPDVAGTVARGDMLINMDYMTGIDMEALTQVDARRAERLVRSFADPSPQQEGEQPPVADTEETSAPAEKAAEETVGQKEATGEAEPDAAPAAEPSVMDTTPWLTKNPLELNKQLLERGQTYFGIYCSVCHGLNGGGNGLVNRRAQKILATNWIPPSKLNQPTLAQDVYPDGKLFNTISNGIRKMPGYAAQITTRDRWAIVAYVRALQQSQNASIDEVPAAEQEAILKQQAEVKKQLEEQAAAEAAQANAEPGDK